IVPAAVGLIVLRVPIVQLLFERGAFDERATVMTAVAVLFYSIGLVGFATNIILTRGFYAFQDTATPVKLLSVNLFLNLILSVILMGPMAHGGLALASSLSALVNTVLLVWYLERRLPGIWNAGWLRFMVAVLLASGVMAWATLIANNFLAPVMAPFGLFGLVAQVSGAILVGVVAYALSCIALRFEEVYLLKRGSSQILDGVRGFITGRSR
ncbi:MAG: murein biosynthesis integral membrane protein MurJ, partial [Desulforudis sp.]